MVAAREQPGEYHDMGNSHSVRLPRRTVDQHAPEIKLNACPVVRRPDVTKSARQVQRRGYSSLAMASRKPETTLAGVDIDALAKDDKLISAVLRELQARGLTVAKAAPDPDKAQSGGAEAPGRRGPRPGMGGRPSKSGQRRMNRAVALVPELWKKLEDQQLPGESMNDTIARILTNILV